jgi:hypothetical protein
VSQWWRNLCPPDFPIRFRDDGMCNSEVVMAGTTAQDLTSDEFSSLREVAKGLRQRIPEEHEKRLIELGLIEPIVGGLKLTPRGSLVVKS